MSREEVIEKTVNALRKMPTDKGAEVADFAEFMLKKLEEQDLQTGLTQVLGSSDPFSFLKEEEDLYTLDDLKEKF